MNAHQTRFLSAFSGEMQTNINSFGKQLWEKESDVFIFMARKAACFFDCLRELRIADVRGIVTSDRVLDMDLSFLAGKRVTLVDDCVFSGTTLFNAKNRVQAAGCTTCDTMTLSVNKKWIRPELLPGGPEAADLNFVTPLIAMDDAQCVQQCYDVVRAISVFPRPYDIDFPHTLTAKLGPDDLDRLVHCSGWHSYDVSSHHQIRNDVRAFTLLPDHHVLHCFMDRHAGTIDLIKAAKIRLYARKLTDQSWSVRMVPIVMLGAVCTDDLRNGARIWGDDLESEAVTIGASSLRSRYRLLHFVLSWALLERFVTSMRTQHGLALPDALRMDLAEMAFGSKFSLFADKACKQFGAVHLPTPVPEPAPAFVSNFGDAKVTVKTPRELISACVSPFVWLYNNLEITARKNVLQNGLKASLEEKHKDLSRLRNGFSPKRLIERIQCESLDVARYVSLFLDKAIDLGIAVPTVVEDEHCLYRAFRHGEDAVFGEAEEKLAGLALQAYMAARGIESIWGLELQKFLVLFVQIALRDGTMLERLNTSESVNTGCRVISIKGHLHGPVPLVTHLDESGDVGAPFVEGLDYPAEWLTNDWEQRGMLSCQRTAHGFLYKLDRFPEANIGPRKEAKARKIGRCLGRLVGKRPTAPLNNDTDLVLLSTCAEVDHQIRALSGEVSILVEKWPTVINHIREEARRGRFAEARQNLLTKENVYVAVNSGAMKYRWFVGGRMEIVLRDVERHANAVDPTGELTDEWRTLWPETALPAKTNVPAAAWTIVEKMGQWLITANLTIRLYHYWLLLNNAPADEAGKELKAALADCTKWGQRFMYYCREHAQTPFGQMVRGFLDQPDPSSLKAAADRCRLAAECIDGPGRKAMRQLLDDSRLICDRYGAISDFRPFPYALFIDIEAAITHENANQARLLRLVVSLLDNDTKLVENNHNPWRTGIWLLIRGNRNSTKAAEFMAKLVDKCRTDDVRFRAAVIGQLAYDDCIRDMAGSVKIACGDFYRRITELKPHVLTADYSNCITFVNEDTTGAKSEAEKFCTITGLSVSSEAKVASGGDDLTPKVFTIAKVKTAVDHSRIWRCDVGVLTIVPPEARAVRGILADADYDRKGPKTGALYDLGDVLTAKGSIRVAHLQLREEGTTAAAIAYQHIVNECRPKIVAIVGIGGGISPDVELCDVVIASKIIYYDRRKVTEAGETRSAGIGKMEAKIMDLIRAYQRNHGEVPQYTATTGALQPTYKVQVAPIGCGEAVIAMKDSAIRQWLLSVDRKTLAVEMESSGACHAFWESGAGNQEQPFGLLVVRGISDHADKEKDDRNRIPASIHAAQVLREVLSGLTAIS